MQVGWTNHAKERFFERSLKYNVSYAEVEENVLNQKIKQKQDNKIKTVFKIIDYYFTVIKEETKKSIWIISIWESNDDEVNLWKKKK